MDKDAIFQYSDHREFLSRYLKSRKTMGGLRALALKAGFKSPGLLTMLISGERKLTNRSAELLADALTLKGRRRSLLLAFARVDSARSERDKLKAREEILRLKSVRPEFQMSGKQYSFLATWYYPVVFVLLHQREIPQDSVSLASKIGSGVTAVNVDRAIQDLVDLGLIEKNSEGRWTPRQAAVTTSEDVRDTAIAKYHENSIALSGKALALPLEAREFNGLTVGVPARLMPELKEKIRKFRSELNEFLAHESEPADVYQLNLHLFPLTSNLESKSK